MRIVNEDLVLHVPRYAFDGIYNLEGMKAAGIEIIGFVPRGILKACNKTLEQCISI